MQSVRQPAARVGVAAASAAAGVAAALLLDSVVGTRTYVPLLAAVAICAALAGPAAAAGSAALAAVVMLPIALSQTADDVVRWLTFVATALLVVGFGELLERSRERVDLLAERLAGAERRFRAAEDASPVPFTLLEPVRDRDGRIVDLRFTYANRAALRLSRRTADELVGARMVADVPTAEPWLFPALVRVLETGEPLVAEREYEGVRVSGWFAFTAVPVGDGLATTIRDVTGEHRAAERDRLLSAVAAVMDAAPELAPRVQALATLLADGPADSCRVDVVTAEGALAFGAVAADDPAAAAALRSLPAARPRSRLAQAVQAGRPQLLSEVTEDALRAVGIDPAHESVRRLDPGSAVLLPLRARGRPLGVALLLRDRGRRPFDRTDLDTLVLLSGRAALAFDNARLYEQQRAIASTLQASLLPKELPPPGRLAFAARYRAAGEGLEVGGDFYDVVLHDDLRLAVVGDVCGKGPEAAAVTSLVRHTFRLAAPAAAPAAALVRVNDAVRAEHHGRLFCTAAAAALLELPDGRVAVRTARGGHPPPLVVRADGRIEVLESEGVLLGWLADIDIDEASVTLHPGDALVLYTDGVVEARDGRDLYGEERLRDLLAAHAGGSAEELAEAISAAAMAHARDRPRDDLAVLVAAVQADGVGLPSAPSR